MQSHFSLVRRGTAVLTMVIAFSLIGGLSGATTAHAAGVSVGNVAVTEGDAGVTMAQVPYSWSLPGGSVAVVHIVVTPRLAANAADIAPMSVARTVRGSGSATLGVPVFGDLDREPAQVALITLTYDGISDGGDAALLTVFDDDAPNVTISDGSSTENIAGVTHTISLSKAINQETRLRVQTFAGTASASADFASLDQVVIIPPGATSTTVVVPVVDDRLIELTPSEAYSVQVSAVTATDISAGFPSDLLAAGTILDFRAGNTAAAGKFQLAIDPSPFTCRDDLPTAEAFLVPGSVSIRLELAHAMSLPFEFRLEVGAADGVTPAASAGSDFVASNRVLVFPANTRTFNFKVTINDDNVTEGDEFIGLLATGGMIQNSQPCNQNVGGANNQIKILANAW